MAAVGRVVQLILASIGWLLLGPAPVPAAGNADGQPSAMAQFPAGARPAPRHQGESWQLSEWDGRSLSTPPLVPLRVPRPAESPPAWSVRRLPAVSGPEHPAAPGAAEELPAPMLPRDRAPLGPPSTDAAAEGGFTLPDGHTHSDNRIAPEEAAKIENYDPAAFLPDPDYEHVPYLPAVEQSIYAGKYSNPTQRPWIEWGRGLYRPGEIPPSPPTCLGPTNLVAPHFLIYGDYRVGGAYFDDGRNDPAIGAHRLNLELDWKWTATERVHAFIGPLDRGNSFTRTVFEDGELRFVDELDDNFDTIFFEGDLGAIYGGWTGRDAPFDLPVTIGLVPLLFQNGVWMEDALVGGAVTIPARNHPGLDWANYDITFFAGLDELDSLAFGTDDSAANVYGVHTFVDAYDGYLEVGYAFLDDTSGRGLGYHNLGVSFTRRYFHRVSNSIRFISNWGQSPHAGPQTADGQLLLLENALITSSPHTVVPYLNLFAGFGTPQSVARAGISGGVLRNTGILFETDGLTGFPFLDDTANNTYGGALGLNLLASDFRHQLLLEAAMLQTSDQGLIRRAVADQYGLGARYQVRLTHAWLWRMDVLYGWLKDAEDITGVRSELRYKF